MTRKEAVTFVVVRSLGNFLLLFALYGVLATFGPVIMAETQFRIAQARGISYKVAEETKPPNEAANNAGFAEVLSSEKEQILIAKDAEFSILIPKIAASAKILPNIDPTNEAIFLPALQEGIAHAKGSVFPGMAGNVYLFAHSADSWLNVGRYNAVFYLLGHLGVGDDIVLFFEGKRYDYKVIKTVIANPDDISLLTQAHSGKQQLVLQTCWPPGTTWKRFYVIAEPKE